MYWVYILASQRNGTLYTGVTNDLVRRVHEHREGYVQSFTRKYGVTRLVFVESFDSILQAREVEARLKKWRRDWKLALIEKDNPGWHDLYEDITFPGQAAHSAAQIRGPAEDAAARPPV